jgi:hypothetical protein
MFGNQIVRLKVPQRHQPEDSLLPPHRLFMLHVLKPLREVNAAPHRMKILRFEQREGTGNRVHAVSAPGGTMDERS